MPPLRFQFVGNLFVDQSHEHFSKFVRPNHSPYLALLGNISHPHSPKTSQFLEYCSKSWNRVFWVAGPHELGHSGYTPHGSTFRDNMDAMERLVSKYPNIQIMNHSKVYLENIQVLGTTLWTPVWGHRVEEKYKQPEFQSIQKYNQPISPVDLSEWNQEDITFLTTNLQNDIPTVVLTHHLPHPSLLSPLVRISTMKRIGMEANSLSTLLSKPCKLWLSGASGGSSVGVFDSQTVAFVNSRNEYPYEAKAQKNPYFMPDLYAEINSIPFMPYKVSHIVFSSTPSACEDSLRQKIVELR